MKEMEKIHVKIRMYRTFVASLMVTAVCCGALAQLNPANRLQTPTQSGSRGQVVAATDGKGQVQLFWTPVAGVWPAGGWRIVDGQNSVIADRIVPASPEAMKALSEEGQTLVRKLAAGLVSADGRTQTTSLGWAALYSMSNPDFARAMGLSCTLVQAAPGPHQYKILGLNAAGAPNGLTLSSSIVNTSVATPLPPSPTNVTAKITSQGVALFWTPAVDRMNNIPVIAYWVERDGYGKLTDRPHVVGATWKPDMPAFVDTSAPGEEEHDYSVYSVDVFGRTSAAATVHIMIPDLKAKLAPGGLMATAGDNKVSLQWKASDNPNVAGYIVERAQLYGGPYEAITQTALARTVTTYEDTGLMGGATYYYRLRTMDARGELGIVSQSASARPANAVKPPAPTKLQLAAGSSRVRATWQPVQFPVAGYFVERQAKGDTRWTRLNARPIREALYDDYLGETYGTMMYRVVAVGTDNKESDAGEVAQATLEDPTLPSEPTITSIDGTGGKVSLKFRANGLLARTAQFLVMRSSEAEDEGLVVGDPVPAATAQFTDDGVEAGEHYWYRVVALDAAGNRSDPSAPAVVRVGAPSIPKPAAPSVRLLGQPFPSAEISFALPDAHLSVMVQVRRTPNGSWMTLAGPIQDQTRVVDTNIQAGAHNAYRIVYRAANRQYGVPSDPVEPAAK
jgi:fibronectin type 3 domain-containing protein